MLKIFIMKEVFEHQVRKKNEYIDIKKNPDFILGLELVGLGSIVDAWL